MGRENINFRKHGKIESIFQRDFKYGTIVLQRRSVNENITFTEGFGGLRQVHLD